MHAWDLHRLTSAVQLVVGRTLLQGLQGRLSRTRTSKDGRHGVEAQLLCLRRHKWGSACRKDVNACMHLLPGLSSAWRKCLA